MLSLHGTTLEELLDRLYGTGASDLILSAGSPAMLRVDGRLHPYGDPMSGEAIDRLLPALLAPEQLEKFHTAQAVDFAFDWREQGRIRGNVFRQRGTPAVALRALPGQIPTPGQLGIPAVAQALLRLPHGLILVTGPTGCGKSTSQASMIDVINGERPVHILTVEDPIEYVHRNRTAIVEQREVGVDTPSFPSALRSILREDPDVVLVGEMRDLESIAMTLTIAETGHLVIGTLHTNDTAQSIARLVDVFPSDQQQQIRVQLAASLAAVIHQELLPRIGGGRVAAFEVMVATHPVRRLIRENKTAQLRNVVATGMRDGMQTLESSLNGLVAAGVVAYDDAAVRSVHPEELQPQPVMGDVVGRVVAR